MKLNQKIKVLRKQKGLTQERLAEQLGVSLMTVRRWEWGNTSPNSNMLLRLSEIFGQTPDALLDDENNEDVSAVTVRSKTGKGYPNMAYWGSVADNARNVAEYGNDNDIADVTQMLKRALALLSLRGQAPVPV